VSTPVVKSAERAFAILEYFDQKRRPLSLKNITDHFKYPASSASGLLKSLVHNGYLSYDRYSRSYMPTSRLSTLGNWVPSDLCNPAMMMLMGHLHEMTQETVVLGTQSDLYAQYMHVIPSSLPLRVHMKPGTLRPLASSGIGLAILSARSDEDIDLIVRRLNIDLQADEQLKFSSVLAEVEQVRREGFAFSRNKICAGVGLIAILLPPSANGPLMALGIGGPVWRLEEHAETLLKTMQEGVAALAA